MQITDKCLVALRACVLALLGLALAGCLNAPTNQSPNALSALGIPDHTAFVGLTCESCHGVDRPPPTIQAVTGIQIVHGGGQDCGACHKAGGPTWRDFTTFNHSPLPATCVDCHGTAQPTALINQMLHAYPGVGDCVGCHSADAGVTWANGKFHAYQAVPPTCAECHAAQRPTTLVNGFSHEAGGMGDCAACHHDVGGSWAGGLFSHVPSPAKCIDCHVNDRPAAGDLRGPAPGFDHYAHNGAGLGDCSSCHTIAVADPGTDFTLWAGGNFTHTASLRNCSDCHVGDRPVGPIGTPPFDHANAGTGDCWNCHKPTFPAPPTQPDPSLWAGGVFTHLPAPANCIDCHAADRPTVPVGSPAFDHSIAGMGDCKSCHTIAVANPGNNMALWAGGNFSHVPAPTSCIDCHLGQRPVGLAGPAPGFDHSLGGLGDCVACHKNPGVSWAGAVAGFDHGTLTPATRCDSCHQAKRPAAANTGVAGTDSNGAAFTVQWTTNQFLHSLMPAVDCRNCHTQNVGVAWAPGTFTGDAPGARHTPNPGQCSTCHANQRPAADQARGSPVFYHSRSGGGADSGLGLGDCAACHKSTSTWTGGVFKHSNPSPTTCINCHKSERPTGLAGTAPNQFDHAANGGVGLGDCVSCHANALANADLVPVPARPWQGGQFSHVPKPALCANCHLGEKPTALASTLTLDPTGKCCTGTSTDSPARTYQNDYLHSLVAGDCANCHTVATATPVKADWKGGKFSHSPAPTACTTCHGAATKPTGPVGSPAFDHVNIGAADCVSCHLFPGQRWTGATAVPASVTLKPPTGTSGWGNITAAHPVIDAVKNPGITCASCHGTDTSAKIIGYDHANPVTGAKCVYCHFTNQVEVSYTGLVTQGANHQGGVSNTKDCKSSGCHNPSITRIQTWNAATKTFTNGRWDSP